MTKQNDHKRRADECLSCEAVSASSSVRCERRCKRCRLSFELTAKGSKSFDGSMPPSDDEIPTVVSSRVSSIESLSALATSVTEAPMATVTSIQSPPKTDLVAPSTVTLSAAPSGLSNETARAMLATTPESLAPGPPRGSSEANPSQAPNYVLPLATPVRVPGRSSSHDCSNSSASKAPCIGFMMAVKKEATTPQVIVTRDRDAQVTNSISVKQNWTRWISPASRKLKVGLVLLLFAVLLLLALQESWQNLSHSRVQNHKNTTYGLVVPAVETVYVPGYGFSGFWYILGRLQRMQQDQDPHTHRHYYCYSAGCMGVVATLQGMKLDDVYREAVRIQNQWKSGEIDRYEVTTQFVSWLLSSPTLRGTADTASTKRMLSSLRIITSAPNGWWGVKPVIRTPSSLDELHEMLIQTTWIPFATGRWVWHSGGHNDGAFTSPLHPTCDYHVGLTASSPFNSLEVLLNVVNVNLSPLKVEKFWKAGVVQGYDSE